MSRKTIVGLLSAAALAATAVAATSVLGADGGASPRPAYATVDVDLGRATPAAARPATKGKKKKPKLVYLQSPAPVTINPADPTAGGVGPNIDVRLTGCSKVVDGGVVPNRPDVFVQGNYVASAGEYHVLIGLEDQVDGAPNRTPFTITSHLICLKGVK